MTSDEKGEVKLADGRMLEIIGTGNCRIHLEDGNQHITNCKLTNVKYVPSLKGNYISIRWLNKRGIDVYFHDRKADIIKDGRVLATATISDGLYRLQSREKSMEICEIQKNSNRKMCIHEMHSVLGHENSESIRKLMDENLITGIELINCNCELDCEVCIESKLKIKSFMNEKPRKSERILDIVHMSVCGPMKTTTNGMKKYFLSFIDDFSRYTKIYLMYDINEVEEKMIHFIELMITEKGVKPKRFEAEKSVKYITESLREYLNQNGIGIGYTAELNDIAEHKNGRLVEMVKCMLNESELPRSFWGEALSTATYIQNRIISDATNKTPYELWCNHRPQLKHLMKFGTECFVQMANGKSLGDSSNRLILLGYDQSNEQNYRCFNPDAKKIVMSQNVEFVKLNQTHNENVIYFNSNRVSNGNNNNEHGGLRRSSRANKGKPPKRYGYENVEAKYMDWYTEAPESNEDTQDQINIIVDAILRKEGNGSKIYRKKSIHY